ncbi:Protein of unknown function [Lactobacillus delbrueckii subsp. lactis]|nr:Protein of unknown function [Lactobacillus delbrueckii subsp. bulgaricus]CDR76682.1 Putative uncharacterized protein [Lactobacillus delbrueckii subsp. lactis]CDR74428.1 Protein of unknown function [Lactobacillus delbrueckii subsp. bulgaricus]CDR79906.1 Protein of unknown function [Lactobacillus delbrueckii subsp. lactis]CDR83209.1 Protein of unknown function [Lactobacillus delbrueckii subsp. lactis]
MMRWKKEIELDVGNYLVIAG